MPERLPECRTGGSKTVVKPSRVPRVRIPVSRHLSTSSQDPQFGQWRQTVSCGYEAVNRTIHSRTGSCKRSLTSRTAASNRGLSPALKRTFRSRGARNDWVARSFGASMSSAAWLVFDDAAFVHEYMRSAISRANWISCVNQHGLAFFGHAAHQVQHFAEPTSGSAQVSFSK